MIILGDQSPHIRGLLRWSVLRNAKPEEEIAYFLHDSDSPWVQESQELAIRNGWKEYFSIASRFPWTPDTPGASEIDLDRQNSIRNSLRAPAGQVYLSGPVGAETIFSERGNPILRNVFGRILKSELEWMAVLRQLLGRGRGIDLDILGDGSSFSMTKQLSLSLGIKGDVGSSVPFFRDSPPLTRGVFSIEHFWFIDRDGKRYLGRNSTEKGGTLVPKGEILLLEFALRGWKLGFSQIPYIERTLELRDRFLPGVKMNLIQIEFDWRIPEDPVYVIREEFLKKKFQRWEKGGSDSTKRPANFPSEFWEKISGYWSKSPTALGFLSLGGDLNPKITEHSF
jgi:hypothetical protein